MRTRSRASAAEQRLRAVRRGRRRARRVIKKDQIDIARIVKLPAAELAETEHEQAAARFRVGRIDRGRSRRLSRARAKDGAARRRSRRRQSGSAPPSGFRATSFRPVRRPPRAARRGAARGAASASAKRDPRRCLPGARSRREFPRKERRPPRRSAGSGNPIRRPRPRRERHCCRTAPPAAFRLPACRSRRGPWRCGS